MMRSYLHNGDLYTGEMKSLYWGNPQGLFSIYPWISSYPMREDVIYVKSFLIDWNLAQPYKENFVGRSNKNCLLSLIQQIHTAVWAYLIQNVKCYKYIFIANMLLRCILRSYNT